MDECKESVIHAKVFAHEFYEICKDFKPLPYNSNPGRNHKTAKISGLIIDFLIRIKKAIDNGRCDARIFMKQLIKLNNINPLQIDIWWYLLKCGVLREDNLIRIFDSSEYICITEYLLMCLSRNIFHKTMCPAYNKNMNSDFMEILLIHNEKCQLQEIQCRAYHIFLNFISSRNIVENNQEIISFDTVLDILDKTQVKDSVKKSFLLDVIEVLVQGKSTTLEHLLTVNEHKRFIVKESSKIFHFLSPETFIQHLKEIFVKSSKPVHWENIFYFLSSLATNFKEKVKDLKTLIALLLEDALQNLNITSLSYVFILSRQCIFLQLPNFSNYLNWFSTTFSAESSRPINTKEKAVFFMNFLTELVQFDTLYYLKVHINRAPCLPLDCQSLLSDYVKLVKTKLSDLNEPPELGLFENIRNKTSAEFDVNTVLKIYSQTNEIPKCVLEASLFCKIYYEKKFLVNLLSIYEGKNSIRHKLITQLQSCGKIPNSLFLNYKQLM